MYGGSVIARGADRAQGARGAPYVPGVRGKRLGTWRTLVWAASLTAVGAAAPASAARATRQRSDAGGALAAAGAATLHSTATAMTTTTTTTAPSGSKVLVASAPSLASLPPGPSTPSAGVPTPAEPSSPRSAVPDSGTSSAAPGAAAAEPSVPPSAVPDAGSKADAAASGAAAKEATPAPAPIPQIKEEQPAAANPPGAPGKGKRQKPPKALKTVLTDIVLESQNHTQAIARRYAQLLAAGRYDEARHMHEEEGGRRPDWSSLRATVQSYNELHGAAKEVEQHLVTLTGSELQTFFFTARYKDGSLLPIRVAIDHNGNVSGAAVGSEIIAATKKRYDRYDNYKPRTPLYLPFYGTWTVSNASPGPGNGHYLNANQRFAIDFYITQEVEPGKRRSYRDRGRQNTDYFAYGQDVLAPADGTVVMVVDGIPDNTPGQVDFYYRLGNSIVISLGNGEYAHLCHLQTGSMQVRVGDKLSRGQVVAKCGNSGNSTVPHLHFQLTDGPLVSHAASLPAYFSGVQKDGAARSDVLPLSGDRLTQPPPKSAATAAAAPADKSSSEPHGK